MKLTVTVAVVQMLHQKNVESLSVIRRLHRRKDHHLYRLLSMLSKMQRRKAPFQPKTSAKRIFAEVSFAPDFVLPVASQSNVITSSRTGPITST